MRDYGGVSFSFLSYLEYNVRPLLDLLLAVSAENYAAGLRQSIAAQFSWPLRFPASRLVRGRARERSAHLGLDALDTDITDERKLDASYGRVGGGEEAGGAGAGGGRGGSGQGVELPSWVPRGPSRSGRLDQARHAQKIRLDALVTAALEPLHELLGDKAYLLSDERPSSLDCVAFAYLALGLLPDVPQPWFAQTLRAKFGRLCRYVGRTRRSFLAPAAAATAADSAAAAPGEVADTAERASESNAGGDSAPLSSTPISPSASYAKNLGANAAAAVITREQAKHATTYTPLLLLRHALFGNQYILHYRTVAHLDEYFRLDEEKRRRMTGEGPPSSALGALTAGAPIPAPGYARLVGLTAATAALAVGAVSFLAQRQIQQAGARVTMIKPVGYRFSAY
jgi:hypothetical protein